MEYIYICPNCKKAIKYKTLSWYQKAVDTNTVCRSCRDIKDNLYRNCPKCNSLIHYKRVGDLNKASKLNSLCTKCSENSGKFKSGKRNFEYNNNKSTIPKFSLDKLCDLSLQSMYWVGVIIADGSFRKYRFELSFKESDLDYLQSFASYINFTIDKIKYRKASKSYRLSFSNRNSIPTFMTMFHINYNKTYNPCDFKYFADFNKDQITSILIGLIDGDGHISKDGTYISIAAHKSWESFYIQLLDYLNLDFSIHKRKNCICIQTGKIINRKILNSFINKNKLFVLSRKWNRIKI